MKTLTPQILGMYIGQNAETPRGISRLVGVTTLGSRGARFLRPGASVSHHCEIGAFKLILRPLSSMTLDEAKQMAFGIYSGIFNGPPDEFHGELRYELVNGPNSDKVGMCAYNANNTHILGFTVEKDRGVELSESGNKFIVDQFQCTAQLLSLGFDLFDLIPSGLAIDSTTLK